jgi:hypothetical protein
MKRAARRVPFSSSVSRFTFAKILDLFFGNSTDGSGQEGRLTLDDLGGGLVNFNRQLLHLSASRARLERHHLVEVLVTVLLGHLVGVFLALVADVVVVVAGLLGLLGV